MLSECQTQKGGIGGFHICEGTRMLKSIKMGSRRVVARAGREEQGSELLKEHGVSGWEDEKVLETDGGDGCTCCECAFYHKTVFSNGLNGKCYVMCILPKNKFFKEKRSYR